MVENVVEELAARRVLEDNTNVLFGLDHFVQTHDVGVGDFAEDGDFAVDLCEAGWVTSDTVAPDELDGDLFAVSWWKISVPQLSLPVHHLLASIPS